MKIAVMSSGLGHVARGIETWADTVAAELHYRGCDVTLYKGGGPADRPFERVVRCAQRGRPFARLVTEAAPRFAWRFGFGNAYDFEQTTFALRVLPDLIRSRFDIIHLQDPFLALALERTRRLHGAKVILGHGTEEPPEFLGRFEHIQELSPWYLERHGDLSGKQWFAVPNFVDADRFRPGDRRAARERFGLPQDKLVFLSVAALNRGRKRMDWLAHEFRRARMADAVLVMAGAHEPETDGLLAEIRPLLQDQLVVLQNVPHAEMPTLYQAADVHVMGSLMEVMGISILEAMASGLPCMGHRWPSTAWAIGDGGSIIDMRVPGELALEFHRYRDPDVRRDQGRRARERVESMFSIDAVVSQILSMYATVLARRPQTSTPQPSTPRPEAARPVAEPRVTPAAQH